MALLAHTVQRNFCACLVSVGSKLVSLAVDKRTPTTIGIEVLVEGTTLPVAGVSAEVRAADTAARVTVASDRNGARLVT